MRCRRRDKREHPQRDAADRYGRPTQSEGHVFGLYFEAKGNWDYQYGSTRMDNCEDQQC
jgi:hypothetical protein